MVSRLGLSTQWGFADRTDVLATTLRSYVDDPISAADGTPDERSQNICVLILAWLMINTPLNVGEGQLAARVCWVGATLEVLASGVQASSTDAIMS